jgi:orotidine-5'-phosphate decarboxylase
VSTSQTNASHDIAVRDRLIVALDVPNVAAAKTLVERLDDAVTFYKIGLELAMSGGYFDLMRWLLDADKRVFADLKFYDIPATVAAAVRQLADCGASFVTVHGDRSITEAAADAKGPELRVLAVTVLTSISEQDLLDTGVGIGIEALASLRARQAADAGCDGIIASGLEVERLRGELGHGPLIVTPGIRPLEGRGLDDQRRVVTPTQAFRSGADHIVVGRPVRAAEDPYQAARAIQAEIAADFE